MSAVKRIMFCVVVVWFSVSFSRIGLAEATANEARTARSSALKDLTNSVEGTPKESIRIFKTKDGYLRFIGAAPSTYFAVAAGTPEETANTFIDKWRNLFVNDAPAVEFQRIRVKTQKERSYVRYQQMYAGLEVFAAEMIVQVNSSGGIEAVISDIMRDTGVLDTKKVSLEPSIDALTSQKKGIEFLAEQYKKLEFIASEPVLMIYAPEVVGNNGEPRLVWQMEVGNIGEPLVKENVFIDAHSGEIVFYYSLVCSAMYREIWDYDETYYAVLKRTEGQDPCGITDVNLAYDYLGDTYHFYDVNHGRDSYDDVGADLVAYVRYDNFDGFEWCGPTSSWMRFGPGYVADDVVGHEFTHLVTSCESQLIVNSGESGAIAESFCDMWGEWIDLTNGDGNDAPDVKWKIAEDWPDGALRNMKNPPEYNCTRWGYTSCYRQHPDYYKRPGYWYDETETDGSHFAHHNNGVGNKLSYLMTDGSGGEPGGKFRGYTISGMGIPKTADLFYECQTSPLLLPASDYYDLGIVLTQAAINLHFSDPNRENVKDACRAVGILASGDVIYVDRDANGYNNGTSWDDAYTDLQEAFIAARCPEVNAVWVAAGTYKPAKDINVPNYQAKTFELPEGVALIGHFGGVGTYEICTNQRNFADVNNETILDGQIGDNDYDAVNYVVTANSIEDAVVDGFTIRGSCNAGVSLNDANIAIVNCKLKENCNGIDITNNSCPDIHNCLFIDNSSCGINCYSSWPVITNSTFDGNNITQYAICANWSDVELTDCIVKNHAYRGIEVSYTDIKIEDCCIKDNAWCVYCSDSNVIINHSVIERNSYTGLACLCYSTLNLTNSVIRFNANCGIYLENISSATIKNNWIHNNAGDYGYGIYFTGQSGQLLIGNTTIVENPLYGIYSDSSTEPDIVNSILYYNGTQIGTNNGPLQNVSYSCVQGGYEGTGNISDDPNFFMYSSDPNDFHIDVNSPCKNAGDPYANYDGETDIDGEGRVKYVYVDIGADEYYWSPADFDDDLTVNFIDYALFANVWQRNDPGFSLDGDNDVDYNDLALFCEDWLWQAGWTKTFTCGAGKGIIQSMGWGMSQTMTAGFAPAETSLQSISAEQQIEKVEPLKIEQLIKWLEEIWLDPEARKAIDEDIWLKFIESLKEEL